jgi:nitrite reductase/ring-hydroxylating ferredoxin subunit
MTEERRSRRDLFRMFGKGFAEAAARAVPPAPGKAPRPPAEPPAEAPVERGRLVVDLTVHPLLPGRSLRFRGEGFPRVVLVARVTPGHFAAVDGDCPCCGGALRFETRRDGVLCPLGSSFRMDGGQIEGPPGRSLRSYPVHALGPRLEVELAAADAGPVA